MVGACSGGNPKDCTTKAAVSPLTNCNRDKSGPRLKKCSLNLTGVPEALV